MTTMSPGLIIAIEVIAVAIAALALWMQARSAERKRRADNEEEKRLKKESELKFQNEMKLMMNNMDKKLHGIEVIIHPYGSELKAHERKISDCTAKISKLEADFESAVRDIDRLNRQIETLQEKK